jgi:hypothetical protein
MLLVKVKTPHGAVTLQPLPPDATFQMQEHVNLSHPQLHALTEIKMVAQDYGAVAGIQLLMVVRKLIVNHQPIVLLIIENSTVMHKCVKKTLLVFANLLQLISLIVKIAIVYRTS